MDFNRLIENLQTLAARDSAVVATLRRSLSFDPGTFPAVYPMLEPFMAGASERARGHAYLVAGLWALAARRSSGPSVPLSEAVRRVARQTGSSSVESRFTAVLDADEDELPWRLRQIVSLTTASGIALDWSQLLKDLLGWDHPDRYVQRRWAREYWGASVEPTAASNE
jgi:CRISPR system Cascade subunit CasB